MIKKYCLIGLCLAGLSTNVFCAPTFSEKTKDLLFKMNKYDIQKKKSNDNLLIVARTAFAIWAFSQNTTYGYVTGSLLTIRIAFDISTPRE